MFLCEIGSTGCCADHKQRLIFGAQNEVSGSCLVEKTMNAALLVSKNKDCLVAIVVFIGQENSQSNYG